MKYYGAFEGCPAIWNDTEGWVLYTKGWAKINVAELGVGAAPMTEAEFTKFGQLPALPRPRR